MKTLTITFQCAHNYGAVLQSYALQKAINSMGYDNDIANYTPDQLKIPYEITPFLKPFKIKRFISNSIGYVFRYKRYNKFKNFINNNLKLSKEIKCEDDFEKLNNDYDLFITGSDQVWNPEISLLKPYYLGFNSKNKKKISYAASFGIRNITQNRDLIARYINSIDNISVRENEGIDLVNELIGRDATQVLDPVFLLNQNEWEEIAVNNFENENYILYYSMEENKIAVEIAEKLSEEMRCKIIYINPDLRLKNIIKLNNKLIKLNDVGPNEFLGLINNAKMVITNSFHGTAFSIIMKKPFLSIKHSSRNGRISSLLSLLGLDNHILNTDLSLEELIKNANYSSENYYKLLKIEIENSKEFLRKSLAKEDSYV